MSFYTVQWQPWIHHINFISFRDYLFKCVESCDTITADAYGERHIAFPLRDARGAAIAVVDISIGDSKMLPADEMKEVKKMVQLLAEAHREIAGEIAGLGKMIVLGKV